MNQTLKTLCAAVLLAVPAVALASPSAEHVLKKHLEAVGGEARLREVKSVQLTYQLTEGDAVSTSTVLKARPNRVRYEGMKDGKAVVKAFDGQSAWSREGDAAPVAMPAEKAKMFGEKSAFDDVLLEHAKRGVKLSLAGQEDVDGAPAFKLVLTRSTGDTETRFIDRQSFLETKRVVRWSHEGKTGEKTVRFTDYRPVDGIQLAHTSTWESSDGKKGRTVLQRARFDVPADAQAFRMPEPRS